MTQFLALWITVMAGVCYRFYFSAIRQRMPYRVNMLQFFLFSWVSINIGCTYYLMLFVDDISSSEAAWYGYIASTSLFSFLFTMRDYFNWKNGKNND